MSKMVTISAELRSDEGKGASRRLRRTGLVPAIVYGGDRAPASIQVEHRVVMKAGEDESFYTSVLQLKVGDKKRQNVVLRDVQRHPFKQQIMHLDFQRIVADQLLRMNVPLRFIGEADSDAGKTSGVVISHQVTDVEVSCLPADLPEFIEVDLTEMQPGDVVRLSEVRLPENVVVPLLALGDEYNVPVVSAVHIGLEEEPTDEDEDEDEIGLEIEDDDPEVDSD